VLLCCAERLPGGRGYRFIAEPMLAPRPPESPVRALNRSLERLIRRNPGQYLWGYNATKCPRGSSAGWPAKGKPALLTRIAVAVVWILHFLPLALLVPIGSALGSLLYILDANGATSV